MIYCISVVVFQSIVLIVLTNGAEFILWQNGTILANWKLTVILFPHGLFVLEYHTAGLSNQRKFFLHGSLVLRQARSHKLAMGGGGGCLGGSGGGAPNARKFCIFLQN